MGKGIIIGVVVIFTALSFTLGYFVGKYSAPVREAEVPLARVDRSPAADEPPAHSGPPEEGAVSAPLRTPSPQTIVQEEAVQSGPSGVSAPATSPAGNTPAKSPKPAVREVPASREVKQTGLEPAPGMKQKPAPERPVLYTVQIGAFKGQAEAEQVKEKFDKKGFKTYITVAKSSAGKVYKVRTGEFAERKDAEVLSLKLKKTEGLTAFVTFRNE